MGKGKGMFQRKIIRVRKNTMLFEFSGVSFYQLKFFVKKINKKLNFKTYVLDKNPNLIKTFTKNYFIYNYYTKFFKLS